MKYKIKLDIIELEENNYHVFLKLKIGKGKANLLLDTGASKTVFDDKNILKFVEQNDIRPHNSQSVGLGADAVDTKVTVLRNIRCGKAKIKSMEAAVLNLSHVNQTYSYIKVKTIDGVLGSDFLVKYKALIDYKKAILTITIKEK